MTENKKDDVKDSNIDFLKNDNDNLDNIENDNNELVLMKH